MGGKTAARRRRTGAEARHAILDAAEALLAAEGVNRVQLKPVAAAAGIGHSGVLHHFGSREGLLEALFRRASERMRGEILRELAAPPERPSPEAALEQFVRVYARVADPSRAPILAWLIAAGRDPFSGEEAFGLRAIAERLHAIRAEAEPGAALEHTLFALEVATLAMFGDLLVGSSTRRRLGRADTRAARERFRRRLGALLTRAHPSIDGSSVQ